MMGQMIPTKRGRQMFCCEGFTYYFHKMSTDGVTGFWQCSMKDDSETPCPVRVHVKDNQLIKKLHEHTHESSPATVAAKQIMAEVKQKALLSQDVSF